MRDGMAWAVVLLGPGLLGVLAWYVIGPQATVGAMVLLWLASVAANGGKR